MARKPAGKNSEAASGMPDIATSRAVGNGNNANGAESGNGHDQASITMRGSHDAFSDDEIAARAYDIYEREGRTDGRDMEHWLRAQEELRTERLRTERGQPTNPQQNSPRSARQYQGG